MKDPIEYKVNQWDQSGESKFREINLRILHLNTRLYHDYEPSLGPHDNFITRLNNWLENVKDDSDKKILFELVPNIFYVGREEFNVLYREAYNTNFARWLIDQIGVDFFDPNITTKLNQAVSGTWFCPLTDSLRINQFYHINNIPGKHDFRPDWRSLVKFGDVAKIKEYIDSENIKRIVLLEDFIGNGGQVSKAVMFAAEKLSDIPVLVIPLIICPKGLENSKHLSEKYPHISISSIVAIPDNCFIDEDYSDSNELYQKIHELSSRIYGLVSNSEVVDENIDPYGPFGWRKTGGIIVTHTNTPNNSLPIIHNHSLTWKPLFKRHKRI